MDNVDDSVKNQDLDRLQKITQVIFDSVAAVTGRKRAQLNLKTRLISDLSMESIDTIDLLFEIEKGLGLSLNLADVFQNQRRESGQRDQFDMEIEDLVNYVSTQSK